MHNAVMCTWSMYDAIGITRHLHIKLKSFSNIAQSLHKETVHGCSCLCIIAKKSGIMSEAFFSWRQYMCLVVTCCERVDLLALVCVVLLWVCYFPNGILGQVWYLIVSIPDLCALTFTVFIVYPISQQPLDTGAYADSLTRAFHDSKIGVDKGACQS